MAAHAHLAGEGEPSGSRGVLVVFHHPDLGGPFRSLEGALAWLASEGPLEVIVPGPGIGPQRGIGPESELDSQPGIGAEPSIGAEAGWVAGALAGTAEVESLRYSTLTMPRGPLPLGRSAIGLERDVRAFRSRLRRTRPSLVIAVTSMLPALLAAARLERVPAIADVREVLTDTREGGWAHEVAGRALVRATAALATRITACSERVASQFHGGIGAAPVTTIYPPIDPRFGRGDGGRFRAAVGLREDEPLLLTVGNLTRGRGQDLMIRAMPAVREAAPGARCVIVGAPFARRADLAYAEELRALIRGLGLEGAVILAGEREDVADAYAAAEIVVNPARVDEAFGRVAPEALMAGRPVVAAAVGAVPEVLCDGRTALLVPPGEPERIAAAAIRLLSDPPLAARLAAAGRADVVERFAPQRSLARFQRVVGEALASGARGGGRSIRCRGQQAG